MQRFKERPYWIHLIIDAIITQAIWWGISMLVFHTPVILQSIIAGILLLGAMFIVAWYLPKLGNKSKAIPGEIDGIKVYANRSEISEKRGQLSRELAGYERVWAIWHEGRIVLDSDEVKKFKVERLILTNPNDDYMMRYFINRGDDKKEISKEDIQTRCNTIKDTAKKIAGMGTTVQYYSAPISCSLILADTIKLADDKFSDNAWARIETGIPFQDTGNRPHIVITKLGKPELFEALRQHFIRIWENSVPI
jgi:hypothetical protein